MSEVLGWLGEIFSAILSFVPRIVKIRSTNQGIKFKCGKYPILWEPGLHLYIPAFSDYLDRPIVRQSIELPKQLLFTKDGHQFAIKGVVIFEINDLFKLITNCWDESNIIEDISVEIVSETIAEFNLQEIKTERRRIKKMIYDKLKEELNKYGVKITRFSIKDAYAPDFNLSLWQIGDESNKSYLEEE